MVVLLYCPTSTCSLRPASRPDPTPNYSDYCNCSTYLVERVHQRELQKDDGNIIINILLLHSTATTNITKRHHPPCIQVHKYSSLFVVFSCVFYAY